VVIGQTGSKFRGEPPPFRPEKGDPQTLSSSLTRVFKNRFKNDFQSNQIVHPKSDFQSNQIKIVSYFKSNLSVFIRQDLIFLNGNCSMNFLTFKVGNPSAGSVTESPSE
jgi:hypothetical protein